MQRVLIVGCSGAGKSTLARTLGERLALPVHHLDRLFWLPGWVERNREEFLRDLNALLQQDSWIIDGNYKSTLELRLAACDTVVYLDVPFWHCVRGVVKRRFGSDPRPDVPEGCPERFDWEFYRHILNHRRKHRPRIEALLAAADHIRLHRLRSNEQIRQFLSSLPRASDYGALPAEP